MSLSFRNATLPDLPAIVAIYNSTVLTRMVTADTEAVSVESRRQWFDGHNEARRPLWVVKHADQLIGWVSFQSFYGRPAYDATAEISLYLDERFRGRGFGKKILVHCLAQAPRYKIKTLLGFIFAHNEPSLRLFKSLEFEEWAHLRDVAQLDGTERSLKIVGKRLQ